MIINDCVFDLENSMDIEPDAATWYDLSRYKNHGTITAGTGGWVQLPSGLWVYDFDGTASFVAVQPVDPGIAYSVFAVVNFTSFTATRTIFGSGGADNYTPHFNVDTNGNIRGVCNGANAYQIGTTVLVAGTWNTVCYTVNDRANNVYVNGELDDPEFIAPNGPSAWDANHYIGKRTVAGAHWMLGQIGFVMFFNYELIAGQVRNWHEKARYLFGVHE